MAKNKDRDPSEMILGTFRVKSGMWEHFKQLASDNNATATDLILSFIENCLQSESIPQSNLDVIPQSNLDDIYTYIDSKLDNTPSIQNIENLIDARISGSIADGSIRDAIASSYVAAMGQMNGLIDEVEALKKQMEALKLVPPAAAAEQLNVECDLDSDFASDTQLIPDPTRNQIENIRTTLKRKGIQSVTNEKIRKAFYDAGWDGDNLKEIRQAIIDSLSPPK